MSIVSTLYLSSDSLTNPPIASSNLAKCSWLVDWDTIFHGRTGLCKLSINMVSKKGAVPDVWDSTVGSIRANFSSNYCLNANGFPIAPLNRQQYIEVSANGTGGFNTTYVYYYSASNVQNSSLPVISIPTGKQTFTIMMLDTTDNFITSFPNYNVFLNFEWIPQHEIEKNA